MKKMKICIANSFYPPYIGGAETYVGNLARRLADHGHDVTVYCAHTPLPAGESIEDGVRIRRMRAPIRLYGTPVAVSPLNLLAEDYDVIHCNFPSPYFAALFALFSRIRGIPAVLTWHNDLPPVSQPPERSCGFMTVSPPPIWASTRESSLRPIPMQESRGRLGDIRRGLP